jgi:tRNA A-37 threonylcarbamoyl transferase component Bud32
MSTTAVATFLAQLRQARILDESQLADAERLGQAAARPAEVAAELVRRGWLTTYQANQVARGGGAELVLGSYLVLEPLARGGMGRVVKARHRYLHQLRALKLIRHDPRDGADTVQRFQREVRLLAELRHPHIVQAYDAGNLGDVWFLAMELLDGIDLDKLVRQRGALPVGQACAYTRQAALGLQHAHEHGLVHRDVKPSNLFLTSEGIKLLDLGLARAQAAGDGTQPGELTRANTVMGTPDYLSPEQAWDPRRADARSDLYSLGCTLYFLLTGRPPFPEGTLTQKLLSHQTVEPPPVETLAPSVPPALAALLRRLVAKSPQQRPASAALVARELATLVGTTADGVPGALPANGRGSLPPAVAAGAAAPGPSLVNAAPAAPERGFTLAPETIPPLSPVTDDEDLPPGPPADARPGWSPAHVRLVVAGGVAVACLLLVVGVVLIGGAVVVPAPGRQTSAGEAGKAAKTEPPSTWTVLFRSDDPAVWNTDSPGKQFARSVRQAPNDVRYLRLKRMDTGDSLIIAITHGQLDQNPKPLPEQGYGWNGTAKEEYKGRHLGILHGPRWKWPNFPPNGISVLNDGWDGFGGSGFGHKVNVVDKQYHCWQDKEIPKTVFEIAVTAGPLTEEEQRRVVK